MEASGCVTSYGVCVEASVDVRELNAAACSL